jgi:hypothetical protein
MKTGSRKVSMGFIVYYYLAIFVKEPGSIIQGLFSND